MTKFYTGTAVSRDLPAEERSWDSTVYQSGKPVLDSELNLSQDIRSHAERVIQVAKSPSGWLRETKRFDALEDYFFFDPSNLFFVADGFYLRKLTAQVAGFPVVVEYTNTDLQGLNLVQLDEAPVLGGAPPDVKRTDFVFLEVWRTLVAPSAFASGTVQIADDGVGGTQLTDGDTVTIGAVTFTARAVPALPTEFPIGPSPTTVATALAGAINTEGTYTAAVSGAIVTVFNDVPGVVGNTTVLAATAAIGTAIVLNAGDPSPTTLKGGTDAPNKPNNSTVYRHGNVLSPTSVGLPDDIQDPALLTESTQRIQIQYRIRVTGTDEAINFKTQPDGFSNPSVLAQGTQSSPVAMYSFVPADGVTSVGSSDAASYPYVDSGLWVAGDGTATSAANLGTVDGFVYAIPLCFVFRRNNAVANGGFNPRTNANGAAPHNHAGFVGNALIGPVPAGVSDRPDGLFSDGIVSGDVLDLRRHVQNVDAQAELRYQIQSLLDGSFYTWAIDTADKQELGSGSGTVGVRPLVANEIGRASALGGNDITSGDTQHGVTVRNFDHIARRFADWPVTERVMFALLPTDDVLANPGLYNEQANPGSTGWYEGDRIHIDISNLNASTLADWSVPSLGAGASPRTFMPPGTMITDVLRIHHDDGHYVTPVLQAGQAKLITGLGTDEVIVTLDSNPSIVNGGDPGNPDYLMVDESTSLLDNGSPRRIFVELEITYPIGSGTTDTPDEEIEGDTAVWPVGPLLENDPTQRSPEMETPTPPRFREGFREIGVEQLSNNGTTGVPVGPVDFVSETPFFVTLDRRISGLPAHIPGMVVTDGVTAAPRAVSLSTDFGSSSNLLALNQALSGAGQTLCNVSYFAQDPIPNYGAAGGGYQITVYYRSNAPQTAGSKEGNLDTLSGGGPLPSELTVQPIALGTEVTTILSGKGSPDLPFPYASPMDQIPVNDGDGYYAVGTPFPGDWYFASTATVAVQDFNAETGMLQLHPMVPMDGSSTMQLGGVDGFPYTDVEFRALYDVANPSGYQPTVMTQPLAGAARHKVAYPVLARATEDSRLFRKGELLLVVFSRFGELDTDNTVRFTSSDNRTAAAVYRTKNLLLTVGDL